ncbi:MAG: hypothetical protein IPN76_17930 [Saprospiraceae bacterium]|nr:hypothetical protein [Saprospiraceae bacterium]
MSFHHKYFRLFEVRLLHEYYLLGEDGVSFYDLSPADRVAMLEKRLLSGQYKLMDDILIVPTKDTKELLDKRRLRLVQNFTGFAVVGRGESATLSDGTPAIKPMVALDENLELLFRISIKEPKFKNYTSLPLRRPQEGGYYFANSASNVKGTGFLSMSQSVPDFIPGTDYSAGDLARFAGVLREANAMTNSNANWDNIESDGYVNESDRLVLNHIFRYRPMDGEVGGAFEFVLKQPNGGAVVKTIAVPSMPFLGQRLDFFGT